MWPFQTGRLVCRSGSKASSMQMSRVKTLTEDKAATQSRMHTQAARSTVCWLLCVCCFYWGFRPFHGRNKAIRTCYNIPPHTPSPFTSLCSLTDSRGLPEATIPPRNFVWIWWDFVQLEWSILGYFLACKAAKYEVICEKLPADQQVLQWGGVRVSVGLKGRGIALKPIPCSCFKPHRHQEIFRYNEWLNY